MLIRFSTNDDLAAVRAWLTEEDSRKVHGNFFCNWSVITRAHERGNLLVCIDTSAGLPVSFQLGGLISPGILQVREAYRGTGLGKRMVEHCIELAIAHNEPLLYIECKPSTSIPFWQRMGFQLVGSGTGINHAFRTIDKALPLPANGVDAKVIIRFYPKTRDWDMTTQPYATNSPTAKRDENGTVHLAQRVLFHEQAFHHEGDLFVEIEVDGIQIFHDKAKRLEAAEKGLIRSRNGCFIDRIIL